MELAFKLALLFFLFSLSYYKWHQMEVQIEVGKQNRSGMTSLGCLPLTPPSFHFPLRGGFFFQTVGVGWLVGEFANHLSLAIFRRVTPFLSFSLFFANVDWIETKLGKVLRVLYDKFPNQKIKQTLLHSIWMISLICPVGWDTLYSTEWLGCPRTFCVRQKGGRLWPSSLLPMIMSSFVRWPALYERYATCSVQYVQYRELYEYSNGYVHTLYEYSSR